MKTVDFLEKHTHARSIIEKYYIEVMQASVKNNMPSNFKDYIEQRGFTTSEMVELIEANPRSLIDVFDKNNIHACLHMTFVDSVPQFIINIDGALGTDKFTNRKDAEKQMILECITFLEHKV